MKLFTDTLRDYRKGVAIDEATTTLASVVNAVRETGKAGTLTMKVTVKPRKGDTEQLSMQIDISASPPKHDLPEAIFYVDGEGGLHRNDPNQQEMFVDAKKPPTPLAAV